MIINIERFAGINFAIATIKTAIYLKSDFGTSFLKFICP